MEVMTNSSVDLEELLGQIVAAGAFLGTLTSGLVQLVIVLWKRKAGAEPSGLTKRILTVGCSALIGSAAYGVQLWLEYAMWNRGEFAGLLLAWIVAGGGSQIVYLVAKLGVGAVEAAKGTKEGVQ